MAGCCIQCVYSEAGQMDNSSHDQVEVGTL